jgi:hypothetical protein
VSRFHISFCIASSLLFFLHYRCILLYAPDEPLVVKPLMDGLNETYFINYDIKGYATEQELLTDYLELSKTIACENLYKEQTKNANPVLAAVVFHNDFNNSWKDTRNIKVKFL